jgi:hypothetical protein
MIGIKLDNTGYNMLPMHMVPWLIIYIYIYQDRCLFVGLADQGKDIVFRFIIKYSSLKVFGP